MTDTPRIHVAVLLGGISAEREVSLVSGAAATTALKEAGYRVTPIDVQRDVGSLLTRLHPRPDVVFNALHGRYGEDGCIQGLLNYLDIPYTHSGVLASALAMDKPMAKQIFADAGIPVAEHRMASMTDVLAGDVLPRPYVIKPANDGSSVGVHIVHDDADEPALGPEGWTFGEKVMVEAFVPGRELTVSVMGDRALGVTEIETEHEFYDYDAKYAAGGSSHTVPANIPDDITDRVMELAVRAHNVLGCKGVSRADFRWDETKGMGGLVILEINTQPGLTPTSLTPEQAAQVGISFVQLVRWMVEQAGCDT